MKTVATLLLLPLGIAAPKTQDPETISKLVESLADPRIDERESAMTALIELGEPAVQALQEASAHDDAEVRERAECALIEIRRRSRLSTVYSELKPITLSLDQRPRREVVDEITRQSGIRIQDDTRSRTERTTVHLTKGTFMEAMDAICRENREIEWGFVGPTTARLFPQPYQAKPACYPPGFRIALKRVEVYRSSNFRDSSGMLWLFLEAMTEPGIQVSGAPVFHVSEVVDETGAELLGASEPGVQPPSMPAGSPMSRDFAGSMDSRPFAFGNLGRFARRLGVVRGKISFFFALGSTEVALDNLTETTTSTFGDLTVQATDAGNGCLQVTVSKGTDSPASAQLIDLASISIVDVEGGEHHPVAPIDIQNYYKSGHSTGFYAWFDRDNPKVARSVKFRVVNEFYEKVIPFEFRNVALP
jgi:hypothetical protein